MAYYRQNEPNTINRDPWPWHDRPKSVPIFRPGKRVPQMENNTEWTPYGLHVAHPYFGGWDGLGGRLMHVEQADGIDMSANPWPNNGVNDQPNAAFILIHLDPTTSAHPGLSLPDSIGPAMVFHAPPVFGFQTEPIPAMGV